MRIIYVEAKDEWGNIVWLKCRGQDIEVLDGFDPNPFTRQVWTGRDKIRIGDFEYTIVSNVAYTDGEEVVS